MFCKHKHQPFKQVHFQSLLCFSWLVCLFRVRRLAHVRTCAQIQNGKRVPGLRRYLGVQATPRILQYLSHMRQTATFPLSTFDNAMTFGLCGCSVALFVSGGRVHTIHHPEAGEVIRYIQKEYERHSGNTIVLKVPGVYGGNTIVGKVPSADAFEYRVPQDDIWRKELQDLPVTFVLYHTSISSDDKYNSCMYVKSKPDGIYYTSSYGLWQPLLMYESTDTSLLPPPAPSARTLPVARRQRPEWLPLLKAKIEDRK